MVLHYIISFRFLLLQLKNMLLRLTHVDMLESHLLLSNCSIMPPFLFYSCKRGFGGRGLSGLQRNKSANLGENRLESEGVKLGSNFNNLKEI